MSVSGGLCCPKGAVRITPAYNLPDALVFITSCIAPNWSETIIPEQSEMTCIFCNGITAMAVNKKTQRPWSNKCPFSVCTFWSADLILTLNVLCAREAYYHTVMYSFLKPYLNPIIAGKHGQFLGNAAWLIFLLLYFACFSSLILLSLLLSLFLSFYFSL